MVRLQKGEEERAGCLEGETGRRMSVRCVQPAPPEDMRISLPTDPILGEGFHYSSEPCLRGPPSAVQVGTIPL